MNIIFYQRKILCDARKYGFSQSLEWNLRGMTGSSKPLLIWKQLLDSSQYLVCALEHSVKQYDFVQFPLFH